MNEHYLSDKIVSPEEVRKAEESFNYHVRSRCQTIEIGEAAGRGLVNSYSTLPCLQGLCKVHKGDIEGNPIKGHKLQPLVAANKAPNVALGNLLAKVTKAVGNNLTDVIG